MLVVVSLDGARVTARRGVMRWAKLEWLLALRRWSQA